LILSKCELSEYSSVHDIDYESYFIAIIPLDVGVPSSRSSLANTIGGLRILLLSIGGECEAFF